MSMEGWLRRLLASPLMRVSLHATCLADTFFPGSVRATVEVLERVGCEVRFPENQTCCGQLHMNSGYREDAAKLAAKLAADFADDEAIVTPSGSCAAMMREYYPRLSPDAAAVAPRVFELSEFLVGPLGVEELGAYFPHRVALHPTCHSVRSLGVGDGPERLLRAVSGLTLVPLDRASECCGFGGTFAIKNADTSTAILVDKVRAVLDSGADVVTAVDNSCLMHIEGALSRQRTGIRVAHLAEILNSTGAEIE